MIGKISTLEKSVSERVFEQQTVLTDLQGLTSNQRIVYKELLGLGRSAGAYELLDLLHKKGINAAATVYRALNDLVKRGFVQRIVSTRKFVAHNVKIEVDRDSVLLICQHCNEVSSLVDSSIIEAFDKNLKQCGYDVKQYNLELMISCDACANKK